MIERCRPARLAAVTLPVLAAICIAAAGGAAAESWRAANLDPDARLHLRQKPNNRSKVLAYIPGDARGLRGGPCTESWCPIEFRGLKGWVFRRFLQPDNATVAAEPESAPSGATPATLQAVALKQKLRVVNPEGRPIPVYAFPNDGLPVAGRLPADTATVDGLGTCIGDWCYVRSDRVIGWVSNALLRAEDEDAPEPGTTAALGESEPPDDEADNETVPTAAVTHALPRDLGDTDIKTYALAGLAGQSSLPMRADANDTAAIVAWIPNGSKDVEGLRKCVERWCLVRHGEASGWVARRHLADEAVESSQTFQVSGLALWSPLDVLDYPSANAAVVGQIPSYATGIVPIGGCDDDWCHVRYLGIAGWVKGGNLEPQRR